jgi:aspartyl-tRNA(Asn)/glutamyl-tRNA(Gln) amidotransferase subunit B
MRSKEESNDYRYFPEPDLVPVAPGDDMRAEARAAVPELPAARRARIAVAWGVTEHDARVLVDHPALADYAEAAVAAGAPGKDVVNWCTGEVLAFLNDRGLSPTVLPLSPDGLAELIGLVQGGTLSRALAKDVLDECLKEPKRPKQVVEERGLAQVSDEGELGAVLDEILGANESTVAEYRAGDEKVQKKKRGFLFGQVMQATERKADPALVNRLLDEKLGS